MQHLVRRILYLFAGLMLAFTAFNALSLHASHTSLLTARSLWASFAVTIFSFVAARSFSLSAQFRLVLLLFLGLIIEVVLQAAGWLGVLPMVATKEKCAYGRVYWATEGRGNSIRNRDGWYMPEPDARAAHRVAVIGDSFVEAVEVGRDRHHPALLDARLHRERPGWAAVGLGTHGTSPAFHREIIDYAARHYAPEQAVLCIYLGNDLLEMMAEAGGPPVANFLYYRWQPDGQLALDPHCAPLASRFREGLEYPHRSLLLQAPTILRSHCMSIQLLNSAQAAVGHVRRKRALQAAATGADEIAVETARLGNNAEFFVVPPTAQAVECMKLLQAQIDLCAQTCAAHGIKMSVVTIPYFPAGFYRQTPANPWTSRVGRYDFLAPEAELAAFAQARGWPFVGLGERMQKDGLPLETIRDFYHLGGIGHFTEAGHRYCADAVFAAISGDRK